MHNRNYIADTRERVGRRPARKCAYRACRRRRRRRRQAELAFERSLTERLRAELGKATAALAAQKRRADQAAAPLAYAHTLPPAARAPARPAARRANRAARRCASGGLLPFPRPVITSSEYH